MGWQRTWIHQDPLCFNVQATSLIWEPQHLLSFLRRQGWAICLATIHQLPSIPRIKKSRFLCIPLVFEDKAYAWLGLTYKVLGNAKLQQLEEFSAEAWIIYIPKSYQTSQATLIIWTSDKDLDEVPQHQIWVVCRVHFWALGILWLRGGVPWTILPLLFKDCAATDTERHCFSWTMLALMLS